MKLTIGMSYMPSDNPKSLFYKQAIEKAAERLGQDVEVVSLSEHPGRLEEVDAVLFPGGADIAPARYGKSNEAHLCVDINEKRDHDEFIIAEQAEKRELPVLGICRGAQLMNVYRGGTLMPDIETYGGTVHTKLDESTDRRHNVKLTPGSAINRILRATEGEINSAHHQGIERVGDGLQVTARAAEDGTPEAIEWADPKGKPFFLAVQWHPERMNFDEPFAGQLFETFLWETAAYKLLRSRMAGGNKENSGQPHEPIVPWAGE